jgi:ribosomal protein S18 acetylase RimI-like enzyme
VAVSYKARRRPTDDPALLAFLMANKAAHLYLIGDLAPPHNRFSSFATAEKENHIKTVAMLYRDGDRFALLAGGDPFGLLAALEALELPRQVAFQLTLKEVDVISAHYEVEWAAPHLRMIRQDNDPIQNRSADPVRRLGADDLPAVRRLALRVPDIWFTENQYHHNPFVGVFDHRDALIGMGGFHLLSRELGIAALGSIGVDPDHRGQGHGKSIVYHLLQEAQGVDVLGLNVARENRRAVNLYKSLGFQVHSEFQGGIATLRTESDRA